MAGVTQFTDLISWQKARVFAKAIFKITQQEPFSRDYRLIAQINDSCGSVMANIAEGFGRGTQGEFITFLGYSIGSLNETQSHLALAFDRGYVGKDDYARLFRDGNEIRRLLVAFIGSMTKAGSGVKNLRKARNWSEDIWERYERLTGLPRPWLRNSKTESSAAELDTTGDATAEDQVEESSEVFFNVSAPID